MKQCFTSLKCFPLKPLRARIQLLLCRRAALQGVRQNWYPRIKEKSLSCLRSICETRRTYSAAQSLFAILPKPRRNLFTDCDRIRCAATLFFIVCLGIHAVFCRLNSTPPSPWQNETSPNQIATAANPTTAVEF